MEHLSVPLFYDPMFWMRLAFISAVSSVALITAIVWVAKRTLITELETASIKQRIAERGGAC